MQRRHSAHPAAQQLAWDDVKLFLALCRAKTLRDAARALGVDTSTVSRRLSSLEETLGATLFDRDRGGVHPTSAVEPLLPVAEEIEHAMLRFAGAAESLERDVTGVVRIACPSDAAEALILPALPELLARHPAITIELVAGEETVEVARRAADIALRTVRPQVGDLLVRVLGRVTSVPAAAPSLAEQLGTVRRWDSLPWVTWSERFGHIPLARWVSQQARGTEPLLRSDNLRVQIAAVQAGLGVALLPQGSVRHYGLSPLKPSERLRRESAPYPEDDLFLVTHRALRSVPRVAAVWAFLLAQAEGLD